MELNFVKNGDVYIATFETSCAFNVHIEKGSGSCKMYQKTVEDGDYDRTDLFGDKTLAGIIDTDWQALVYPKYIKIECKYVPTMAVVTFAK